jgi:putative SbcD/Mre11-related phosphoesterase
MTDLLDVEIRPGLRLSAERSLYFDREHTLVVADIHWGYAHSHRQIGNLLPLWGNEEIGRRLNRIINHYSPKRMIWLGDSLHTKDAAPFAEAFLENLSPRVDVVIVAGNHDRMWPRADKLEFRLSPYLFHHGDRPPPETEKGTIEIIGHLHPALSWSDGAGLRLKVPALVEGSKRIVLPSFSDWSAGATWNGRLESDEKLWLISSRRIWAADKGSGTTTPT